MKTKYIRNEKLNVRYRKINFSMFGKNHASYLLKKNLFRFRILISTYINYRMFYLHIVILLLMIYDNV